MVVSRETTIFAAKSDTMMVDYNARLLASDIRTYFETNPEAVEVLIFKGKKTISVNRYQSQNSMFYRLFRKKYEK